MIVSKHLVRVFCKCTPDFGFVAFRLSHHQSCRLAIERVLRVRIPQQLGEEDFEDVDHVEHGRPCLVDNVEAY